MSGLVLGVSLAGPRAAGIVWLNTVSGEAVRVFVEE